jgi:hypothetical protein
MIDLDTAYDIRAALNRAVFHKANGRKDHASAWAAELCRLLDCGDIVNTRGQELRRDFHAGPRDAIMSSKE